MNAIVHKDSDGFDAAGCVGFGCAPRVVGDRWICGGFWSEPVANEYVAATNAYEGSPVSTTYVAIEAAVQEASW